MGAEGTNERRVVVDRAAADGDEAVETLPARFVDQAARGLDAFRHADAEEDQPWLARLDRFAQ
jgi:hypothetical protein